MAALFLASCSSEDPGGEGTAEETTDTETSAEDDGPASPPDGPLHITALLPQTGTQASAAEPIIAATQLAINHINEAGGVFGEEVVYDSIDSTSDNETALAAVDSIVSSGANIVVGPYGSGMAAAVIGQITEAGLVQISGSNTSSSLTGISDRYFRTAPTDALEAAMLTDLIVGDGHSSVALIWQNDSWGAAFEHEMVENLEAAGVAISTNEPYNIEETDFNAQVNAVVASNPDAVVFLSYAVHTGSMVESLVGTNGFPSQDVYFSSSTLGDFSDSLSDQSYLDGIQAFQPGALEEVQAQFEADSLEINPNLESFAYSASTYDAAILGALAAEAAQSTDPDAIAAALTEISREDSGGELCTTYAECLDILNDGGAINYDGLTGPIEFDENNDVGDTNYLHFVFSDDGTYSIFQ